MAGPMREGPVTRSTFAPASRIIPPEKCVSIFRSLRHTYVFFPRHDTRFSRCDKRRQGRKKNVTKNMSQMAQPAERVTACYTRAHFSAKIKRAENTPKCRQKAAPPPAEASIDESGRGKEKSISGGRRRSAKAEPAVGTADAPRRTVVRRPSVSLPALTRSSTRTSPQKHPPEVSGVLWSQLSLLPCQRRYLTAAFAAVHFRFAPRKGNTASFARRQNKYQPSLPRHRPCGPVKHA